MEHRGKHYTIVQGIVHDLWHWKVYLDEKNVEAGEAKSRDAARNSVVWVIDKTLAPKSQRDLPRD